MSLPGVGETILIPWWRSQDRDPNTAGPYPALDNLEKRWIEAVVRFHEAPDPSSGNQYFAAETVLQSGTTYRRRLGVQDLGATWREPPLLDAPARIG